MRLPAVRTHTVHVSNLHACRSFASGVDSDDLGGLCAAPNSGGQLHTRYGRRSPLLFDQYSHLDEVDLGRVVASLEILGDCSR